MLYRGRLMAGRMTPNRHSAPRYSVIASYIKGSPLVTTGVTTARTTDLWLPNASGTYVQYGNGEVGIVDGDAVWCQPSATNYTDGTDDLSGGPETVDLTSAGTGNYTLSVIGTAAVTVAAGTAVGTGFGQATEGNPVTFNLSTAGTVTLTLDSGTLDTIGSSAAKQIEKNAFATSFIPTPAGTPVAINATEPVVPWPSGLVNDFVVKVLVTPSVDFADVGSFRRILDSSAGNSNGVRITYNSGAFRSSKFISSSANEVNVSQAITPGADYEITARYTRTQGGTIWVNENEGTTNTDVNNINDLSTINPAQVGHSGSGGSAMLGKIRSIRFFRVIPSITDAEVLAL